MNKKKIGICLGLLFVTGSLHASDIWLETRGSNVELMYGDGIPEVYNPAKVKEFIGYDKKGHAVPLQRVLMDDGFVFVPNPNVVLMAMALDDGYWVPYTPTESRNVSRDVAGRFSLYRHPMLFHKSIYAWSSIDSKPAHQKMEIVPLKNPLGKHSYQDMIQLQVLFDGKPLSGASVEYSPEAGKTNKTKTDANGKVKVPYVKGPVQYVVARYAPPATSGEAFTYTASLRFELKP